MQLHEVLLWLLPNTWSGRDYVFWQKLFSFRVYVTVIYYLEVRYPQCCHPGSKIYGAKIGPIWGRQDPGGPHVGPMNFAIWELNSKAIQPEGMRN